MPDVPEILGKYRGYRVGKEVKKIGVLVAQEEGVSGAQLTS